MKLIETESLEKVVYNLGFLNYLLIRDENNSSLEYPLNHYIEFMSELSNTNSLLVEHELDHNYNDMLEKKSKVKRRSYYLHTILISRFLSINMKIRAKYSDIWNKIEEESKKI